jgi:hypothetical protein
MRQATLVPVRGRLTLMAWLALPVPAAQHCPSLAPISPMSEHLLRLAVPRDAGGSER